MFINFDCNNQTRKDTINIIYRMTKIKKMGIVNNTKNLEQCSQSGVNVPYEELVYPLQFIKIFN